jgi:cytochrome c-type biogenesis protein CcmE
MCLFGLVITVPRKYRFILVGLGILGSILYLVISGIQAEGVKYARVANLASETFQQEQVVKVTGKVQPGSLQYKPEVPLLRFKVTSPKTDGSISVVYEGIKPDALRESGRVILKGTYNPSRGSLDAYSLLAKCPSRYKSRYKSYEETTSTSS